MASQQQATQKMYLLNAQQMNRLTQSNPIPVAGETQTQLMRRTAASDLDEKMRDVLNELGINPYEKNKKYNALLRRYLAFIKQGVKEEETHTRPSKVSQQEEERKQQHEQQQHQWVDETIEEVLQKVSPRDRKNASYILRKMSKNGEGNWSKKGEFVYMGKAVKGSHMLDLIKHLSSSYKKAQRLEPKGWSGFLNTLNELNMPLSSVGNPEAREQYSKLGLDEQRGLKRRIILSPRWSTPVGVEEEEEEEDEVVRGATYRETIPIPALIDWNTPRENRELRTKRKKKKKNFLD